MTSQPLVIHIPHSLGKDEAIRRMKRGLARASSTLPFLNIEEETWSGDRLDFKLKGFGQAASGAADVTDNDVRVEVVLPWLLQRFADLAGNTLRSRAKLLLEKC